ncbi:MAG: type II toxin-antitoxin system VapC family toxin [Oscillospiraceae bacterium]|jgi:PIN domain nuclease of toxin-antitoxin system|nr:type II toxin-antitoxin system VapC family toxin [Oscillospiraceae bacterium]
MKYLLDTHTLIWYCEASNKLSSNVKTIIYENESPIYISVASLWEFTIKHSMSRLDFDGGIAKLCQLINQAEFILLPITQQDLECLSDLPFIHRDPFDRLLVSAAMVNNMTILTIDDNVRKYNVLSEW